MRRVIRGKFQGHVANKTRIVLFAARELSTDFASLDENKHKKVAPLVIRMPSLDAQPSYSTN